MSADSRVLQSKLYVLQKLEIDDSDEEYDSEEEYDDSKEEYDSEDDHDDTDEEYDDLVEYGDELPLEYDDLVEYNVPDKEQEKEENEEKDAASDDDGEKEEEEEEDNEDEDDSNNDSELEMLSLIQDELEPLISESCSNYFADNLCEESSDYDNRYHKDDGQEKNNYADDNDRSSKRGMTVNIINPTINIYKIYEHKLADCHHDKINQMRDQDAKKNNNLRRKRDTLRKLLARAQVYRDMF